MLDHLYGQNNRKLVLAFEMKEPADKHMHLVLQYCDQLFIWIH